MNDDRAKAIPMAAAELTADDIDAVVEVLKGGRLAMGPRTRAFEEALAGYVGARHGVAVNSGTSAIHLLLRAVGVGPGDEVLVPSFTFVASVNPILQLGARPVFLDIRPTDLNLDPRQLEARRSSRTRAVVAVDIFGHPADWDVLERFSAAHGLPVIDDCCEALGAEHRGRRLGSLGAGGAFGFYPNKQITTGEGGMLVTDDARIAESARRERNQGRIETGTWLEHESLGFNYRMDEMSAALGLSQLRRIDDKLRARARIAKCYDEALSGLSGISMPAVAAEVRKSWFVYVILLEPGLDRDRFIDRLDSHGVPARTYFPPVHRQPYLRPYLDAPEPLPVTDSIARRTVALPFHERLQPDEQARVVEACRAALGRA